MRPCKGVQQLVAEAEAEIETWTIEEAMARYRKAGVAVIDIRDRLERTWSGFIPGSFHAPRGLLEFWVDPESPSHRPVFASGDHLVFYCAVGLRSALAAKTVQDMGLGPVSHLKGGFVAWKEAGGPVRSGWPVWELLRRVRG